MKECTYNYSIEDNLEASKKLYLHKTKRKTNLVTLLLIFFTIIGVMTSIGAIIQGTRYWIIGVVSIALLVGYFLIDKIFLYQNQKNQREFFNSSKLVDVTKVRVLVDDEAMIETFLIKEQELGKNVYKKSDLIAMSITKEKIFFIFNNDKIVQVKRACLSEKNKEGFKQFANNLKKSHK